MAAQVADPPHSSDPLVLVFPHTHRVTYAECTIGNHVYYARYLDVLEEARGEFFRALGIPFLALQQKDTGFPVIECRLQFRSAARYDDQLTVEVLVTELGLVRIAFGYRMVNQAAKLILEGTTRHVCSTFSEKPKRLPSEVEQALRPYLKADYSD